MPYIYESILDNIEASDAQSSSNIASSNSDVEGDHYICIVIDRLLNEQANKVGLKSF